MVKTFADRSHHYRASARRVRESLRARRRYFPITLTQTTVWKTDSDTNNVPPDWTLTDSYYYRMIPFPQSSLASSATTSSLSLSTWTKSSESEHWNARSADKNFSVALTVRSTITRSTLPTQLLTRTPDLSAAVDVYAEWVDAAGILLPASRNTLLFCEESYVTRKPTNDWKQMP